MGSYYVNSQSKQQPMFELNLDGIMQLGAKWLKYFIIKKIKGSNIYDGNKRNKNKWQRIRN